MSNFAEIERGSDKRTMVFVNLNYLYHEAAPASRKD